MKRTIASLLAFLLLLAGCTQQELPQQPSNPDPSINESQPEESLGTAEDAQPFLYPMDERIPEEIRQIVAENRAHLFLEYDNAELLQLADRFMTKNLDPDRDRQLAEQLVLGQQAYPQTLTIEQMETDLDFLFGYLQYGYSGYEWFGGDAVFLPMKETMLQEIRSGGREVWSVWEFDDLLRDYFLPVIVDGHFSLGTTHFLDHQAHQYYSVNEEVVFLKQDDNFYTTLNGTEYRLDSVDGQPPGTALKPILTAEGLMAWAAAAIHVEPAELSVDIELVNPATGEALTQTLALTTANRIPNYAESTDYRPYDLLEYEGIKVPTNRRLWTSDEEAEAVVPLQEMVDDAPSLQREPVVVLDLRGNGGGGDWGANWVEGFSGVWPEDNTIYCVMDTQTVNSSEGREDLTPQPGWLEPRVNNLSPIPNDTLVIVLTDQNVGSSGEHFLLSVQQMENVLVIGTNTAGMMLFGEIRRVYMPESHLQINCGYKLNISKDLQSYECLGFMPDLWAPPEEALERAVLFYRSLNTPGA